MKPAARHFMAIIRFIQLCAPPVASLKWFMYLGNAFHLQQWYCRRLVVVCIRTHNVREFQDRANGRTDIWQEAHMSPPPFSPLHFLSFLNPVMTGTDIKVITVPISCPPLPSISIPTYLSVCLFACLPTFIFIKLSLCLTVFIHVYLSVCVSLCLTTYVT